MRKHVMTGLLACCLLLTGCSSLLSRSYQSSEPHNRKYWESEAADTLRAENYQDVVNDLLILVDNNTENAVIKLYNYYTNAAATEALENAALEVQKETPLGAYAVEYITSGSTAQRGYYEANIHISYRRTAEQVGRVVNATSTSALPELLDEAIEAGRHDLAVRLAYWNGDTAAVDEVVSDARVRHEMDEAQTWTVRYYPSEEEAGLIEFVVDNGEELVA